MSPCSFTPSGIFQLTPSRRATLKERLVLVRQYYFNSRPHGGRPSRDSSFSALLKFQLTPSRRATTPPNSFSVAAAHFNSRPHGGRLVLRIYNHIMLEISTHALTEGDCSTDAASLIRLLFQLTPSRRATTGTIHGLSSRAFQLTPSRRATS